MGRNPAAVKIDIAAGGFEGKLFERPRNKWIER